MTHPVCDTFGGGRDISDVPRVSGVSRVLVYQLQIHQITFISKIILLLIHFQC